jgi:glutamyl endopeptidase
MILSFPLFAQNGEKAIMGADTRDQVHNHNDRISLAVGLLNLGEGLCTGTLITPQHIITNGHCVVTGKKHPTTLRQAESFTFTPGKLSAKDPGRGTYRAVRVQTFRSWLDSGNVDFDMAIIKLDRPVPNVKPIALERQDSVDNFANFMLSLNGYSSNRPYGTQWLSDGTFIQSVGANSFLHNLDTLPGTSGAVIRKYQGGKWIGIGIHRGSQRGINRAIMFNPFIFKAIIDWTKN